MQRLLQTGCLALAIVLPTGTAWSAVIGDIAIIGYRSDDIDGTTDNGNDDAFAWVPLVNLAPNQMILFTDDGWTSTNTFRGVEGGIQYTAPAAGLSAGTVMLLDYSRDSTNPGVHTFTPDPTAVGIYTSLNDTNIGMLGFETATTGDNIFVFDGSTASPNFIFGLKTEDGMWDADSTSNDSSGAAGCARQCQSGLWWPRRRELRQRSLHGADNGNKRATTRVDHESQQLGDE